MPEVTGTDSSSMAPLERVASPQNTRSDIAIARGNSKRVDQAATAAIGTKVNPSGSGEVHVAKSRVPPPSDAKVTKHAAETERLTRAAGAWTAVGDDGMLVKQGDHRIDAAQKATGKAALAIAGDHLEVSEDHVELPRLANLSRQLTGHSRKQVKGLVKDALQQNPLELRKELRAAGNDLLESVGRYDAAARLVHKVAILQKEYDLDSIEVPHWPLVLTERASAKGVSPAEGKFLLEVSDHLDELITAARIPLGQEADLRSLNDLANQRFQALSDRLDFLKPVVTEVMAAVRSNDILILKNTGETCMEIIHQLDEYVKGATDKTMRT